MTVLDNTSYVLLADGWGELVGVLALFAFYVVGAIIKKFSGSEKEEESETSYSVELAKKRAKERQAAQQARLQQARQKAAQQNTAHSEWDHRQEAKRQKLEQLRQRAKQPPVVARPQPAPQSTPKPVKQHPDFMGIQQKTQDFLARQAERIQAAMVPPQTPQSPRPHQMFKAPPETPKRTIKKTKHTKVEPVKMQPISQTPLDILLRHPSELRSAIILKEILDKPVALRDEWNFDSYV